MTVHLPTVSAGRASVALLLLTAVVAVGFWFWHLSVHHRVEVVEVHVAALVDWWRAGHVPYGSPEDLPLLQNPYGPLYPFLLEILPSSDARPYLAGRLVSIVAMLLALSLIGVRTWRLSRSTSLALLSALLPLATKPILLFSPVYRVDSIGLLFSVAGFLTVADGRRRARLLVAALFFLLAFLTKLTFVAAPLACLFVLWTRQRSSAYWFAGLLCLLPLSLVTMMWWTNGNYLALAAMGNEPVHITGPVGLAIRVLLSIAWLLPLYWLLVNQGGGDREPVTLRSRLHDVRLPSLAYATIALVVGCGFGANPLASWNYLMEFYLALGLLTGELFYHFESVHPRPHRVRRFMSGHVVLSMLLVGLWVHDKTEEVREYGNEYRPVAACVEANVAPAQRVAVLGSGTMRDAVVGRRALHMVYVPESVESLPSTRELIGRGVSDGRIDLRWPGPVGSRSTLPCP